MELKVPTTGLPSVALPPVIAMPEWTGLPVPILEMPRGQIPSYQPLVVPPQASPVPVPQSQGQKEEEESSKQLRQPQAPKIELPDVDTLQAQEVVELSIPGTEITVPMPSAEIVTAAFTTSVVSVSAALGATSIFKQLVKAMKPVLKQAAKKLMAAQVEQGETWGRQRLRERYLRKQLQRESRF